MKINSISHLKVGLVGICVPIIFNSCAGYANESKMKEGTKNVLVSTVDGLKQLDENNPSTHVFKKLIKEVLLALGHGDVSVSLKQILESYIAEDLDSIQIKPHQVLKVIQSINNELNKNSEIFIPQTNPILKGYEGKLKTEIVNKKYPDCRFTIGFREIGNELVGSILREHESCVLHKSDNKFVIIGSIISCFGIIAEGENRSLIYHLYFDATCIIQGLQVSEFIDSKLSENVKRLIIYCNQSNNGGFSTTSNQDRFIKEIKNIYEKPLGNNLVIV